jgi:disulfide bond formation protein DsbB
MNATIIFLMALAILALNVVLAITLAALCNRSLRSKLKDVIQRYGRLAIFLLSLLAMIGTLWMQYGANLAPCIFCWYQRICMYPIVLISGIAIAKNTNLSEIADYVLGLSVLGAAVALYQHFLQILPSGSLIPCSATDECAVRSVFEFGFITLPWMAVSVFAFLALLSILGRKRA